MRRYACSKDQNRMVLEKYLKMCTFFLIQLKFRKGRKKMRTPQSLSKKCFNQGILRVDVWMKFFGRFFTSKKFSVVNIDTRIEAPKQIVMVG